MNCQANSTNIQENDKFIKKKFIHEGKKFQSKSTQKKDYVIYARSLVLQNNICNLYTVYLIY